jgi:hypothetical protein
MVQSFSDFSNKLLALKETLKREDIANVAGDGAVSMPATAKKVKRKSKTFNVSPDLYDMFRRGKKKFEKWSKYLNMEDEGHRALYAWAIKNPQGILVIQNSQSGEIRALRHNRMGGGQWHKISRGLKEVAVPDKVEKDAEKFVKDLKPKKADFVKRYGKDAKKVMYATGMNMAKKKHGYKEEKKYGSFVTQIKDSIDKIGTHKTIEEQAEFIYDSPFSSHDNNIKVLEKIVSENTKDKITFDKGGKMKVDVDTAKMVIEFYSKLDEYPELQEKFRKMMNGNVQGMKTIKNAVGSFIPVDQMRPIASIGNMKAPHTYRRAYALNAKKKKETAKGPGLGTYIPMTSITARKQNARSNKNT